MQREEQVTTKKITCAMNEVLYFDAIVQWEIIDITRATSMEFITENDLRRLVYVERSK